MKAKAGKQQAFLYYVSAVVRTLQPQWLRRWRQERLLKDWELRPDAEYIRRRVNFYCRRSFIPSLKSVSVADLRRGRVNSPSSYIIDTLRYAGAYPADTRLNFFGGDTFANPSIPTIIRSRRLDSKCDNGVLLNLDRRRHFLRPADPIPFDEKEPKLLFRGVMKGKTHRRRFMQMWGGSEVMDIADTTPPYDLEGHDRPMKLTDHFRYRFILVLEGNDVASSLQWVMASGCVPVMTRPTVEGWLMHSLLIPGEHYIEIAPDFSDAESKIRYYIEHSEEAREIARKSREWASQFADRRREDIISSLVLRKYLNTPASR